jgi:hypothetical protein
MSLTAAGENTVAAIEGRIAAGGAILTPARKRVAAGRHINERGRVHSYSAGAFADDDARRRINAPTLQR